MPLANEMPNLGQLFGNNSILGGQLAMQQMDMANQNQRLNQAGSIQDLFQAEQMNPLKVQEQGLMNQTRQAGIPGIMADNSLKQSEAELAKHKLPGAKTLFDSNTLATISDNDVKALENNAQRMAYSNDPAIRSQGEAMLKFSKEVIKEREKQKYMSDRANELAHIQGGYQERINDANIAAGRWNRVGGAGKGLTGDLATDIEQILSKQKKASEKHNTLIDAAQRAASEGNQKLTQYYLNRAAAIRPQAEAELRTTPRPGDTDMDALGVKGHPELNIAPPENDAPTQGADQYKGWTMQQWKQRYPNASEEALRNALKAKGYNPK